MSDAANGRPLERPVQDERLTTESVDANIRQLYATELLQLQGVSFAEDDFNTWAAPYLRFVGDAAIENIYPAPDGARVSKFPVWTSGALRLLSGHPNFRLFGKIDGKKISAANRYGISYENRDRDSYIKGMKNGDLVVSTLHRIAGRAVTKADLSFARIGGDEGVIFGVHKANEDVDKQELDREVVPAIREDLKAAGNFKFKRNGKVRERPAEVHYQSLLGLGTGDELYDELHNKIGIIDKSEDATLAEREAELANYSSSLGEIIKGIPEGHKDREKLIFVLENLLLDPGIEKIRKAVNVKGINVQPYFHAKHFFKKVEEMEGATHIAKVAFPNVVKLANSFGHDVGDKLLIDITRKVVEEALAKGMTDLVYLKRGADLYIAGGPEVAELSLKPYSFDEDEKIQMAKVPEVPEDKGIPVVPFVSTYELDRGKLTDFNEWTRIFATLEVNVDRKLRDIAIAAAAEGQPEPQNFRRIFANFFANSLSRSITIRGEVVKNDRYYTRANDILGLTENAIHKSLPRVCSNYLDGLLDEEEFMDRLKHLIEIGDKQRERLLRNEQRQVAFLKRRNPPVPSVS